MRNVSSFLAALGLWLGLSCAPAAAQQANNDGFHRRNGQMHILRNGQMRPMTRDARLPTGVLVTKDGFVVDARGRRTELREGQGCDLSGKVVAVSQTPTGALALAPAAPAVRVSRPGVTQDGTPAAEEVRAVFSELFRGRDQGKKHKNKGWKRHKDEDWDD